jgi:hypothetical protein
MPLRDHFNPPLSRTHPWRGFHGAWAAAIARLLNMRSRSSNWTGQPKLMLQPCENEAGQRVVTDQKKHRPGLHQLPE